jgi:hypothetical protein
MDYLTHQPLETLSARTEYPHETVATRNSVTKHPTPYCSVEAATSNSGPAEPDSPPLNRPPHPADEAAELGERASSGENDGAQEGDAAGDEPGDPVER